MQKSIIALVCLSLCGVCSLNSQTNIDCNALKRSIETQLYAKQTLVIQCQSPGMSFTYEKDTSNAIHVICEGQMNQAYIKIKNKQYQTDTNFTWSVTTAPAFNYNELIDVAKNSRRMFEKPLQNCAFVQEVTITGTTYSIYRLLINDAEFEAWILKANHTLCRVVHQNVLEKILIAWHFDLPFTIVAPNVDVENPMRKGLFTFAPSYSTNEKFDGTEPIYKYVDEFPELTNGITELYDKIGEMIKYPRKALANGIQGTVYVGFVIEKDGSMTNFHIKEGIDAACDAEAMRVLKAINPHWKAVMYRGDKVRMDYALPIKFILE